MIRDSSKVVLTKVALIFSLVSLMSISVSSAPDKSGATQGTPEGGRQNASGSGADVDELCRIVVRGILNATRTHETGADNLSTANGVSIVRDGNTLVITSGDLPNIYSIVVGGADETWEPLIKKLQEIDYRVVVTRTLDPDWVMISPVYRLDAEYPSRGFYFFNASSGDLRQNYTYELGSYSVEDAIMTFTGSSPFSLTPSEFRPLNSGVVLAGSARNLYILKPEADRGLVRAFPGRYRTLDASRLDRSSDSSREGGRVRRAISRSGRYILAKRVETDVLSNDSEAYRLLDTETFKSYELPAAVFGNHSSIVSYAFSQDERHLMVLTPEELSFYKLNLDALTADLQLELVGLRTMKSADFEQKIHNGNFLGFNFSGSSSTYSIQWFLKGEGLVYWYSPLSFGEPRPSVE